MNTTPADADPDLAPAGQLFDLGEPLPTPATEPLAAPMPRLPRRPVP